MSDTSAAPSAAASPPPRKAAKTEPPKENPDRRYCNYYVSRKHRFCRTERRPGSCYCPTHTVEQQQQQQQPSPHAGTAGPATEEVRVPCPINPNHTVYASRLAKHVKVCPDLRFVTSGLPYFTNDMHANRGVPVLCAKAAPGAPRVTHHDLSAEELAALQAKVHACYTQHVAPLLMDLSEAATKTLAVPALQTPQEAVNSDDSGRDEVDATAEGDGVSGVTGTRLPSRKHSPQHAALLHCLQYASRRAASLAADGTSPAPSLDGFMELGAGKGGLSVALQALLVRYRSAKADMRTNEAAAVATLEETFPFLAQTAARPRVAVVDMEGFRRKGDAKVRRSDIPLYRLRINMKDFNMTAALHGLAEETNEPQTSRWAALGKHLCGACTDFALSAAVTTDKDASPFRVPVIVIATCCHHRCELRHMNPPNGGLVEEGDVKKEGTPRRGGGGIALGNPPTFTFSEREFAALTSMSSWAVSGDFVSPDKRTMGYECKRVMDAMRVAFLESAGFHAVQCRYTDTAVTGENCCILAWR